MASLHNRKARRCALKIARKIGGAKVIDDPDVLEKYAADESGERARVPAAVVFPHTTAEVSAALKLAAQGGVYITPRGGGTGKSGGAVPLKGGIVLSLEKMKAIEEISGKDFVAVVRPGVVLQDLHRAVERESLFYPPDPASLDSCCLGGNVAENAGGPRAFKYGVTGNYVLSLELVTMGGKTLRTGCRAMKQVAGYNLVPLMVGSEGTLAVFTLIVLKLVPLPEETATCVATFSSTAGAASAVNVVLQAGMVPSVMEIMDRQCMALMQRYGEVHFDEGASCAALLELDGDPASVRIQVDRVGKILEKEGAKDLLLLSGAVEKNRFWEARRNISEFLKRRYPGKISDDISVPRGRMVEAIEKIYKIAGDHALQSAVYGHAGDGNLHVNLVSDEDECEAKAQEARDEIMRLVIAMDGAVSGEHGIGSLKRKYLRWQQSRPVIGIERAIKTTFDPGGLLNPGKIL